MLESENGNGKEKIFPTHHSSSPDPHLSLRLFCFFAFFVYCRLYRRDQTRKSVPGRANAYFAVDGDSDEERRRGARRRGREPDEVMRPQRVVISEVVALREIESGRRRSRDFA